MPQIIMLRHGETEANRARRIQGQDDSPLTRDGIAKIATLADKLGSLQIDPASLISYCSPLNRARATLVRLREAMAWDGPVSVDGRLMEIDFGSYTGRPVDEILPFIQTHKERPELRYPGGESGAELQERVMGFLNELRERHQGGQVLIMAHFGPIETALRHYQNIPLSERVWPGHDQVHCFDFAGGESPSVSIL